MRRRVAQSGQHAVMRYRQADTMRLGAPSGFGRILRKIERASKPWAEAGRDARYAAPRIRSPMPSTSPSVATTDAIAPRAGRGSIPMRCRAIAKSSWKGPGAPSAMIVREDSVRPTPMPRPGSDEVHRVPERGKAEGCHGLFDVTHSGERMRGLSYAARSSERHVLRSVCAFGLNRRRIRVDRVVTKNARRICKCGRRRIDIADERHADAQTAACEFTRRERTGA